MFVHVIRQNTEVIYWKALACYSQHMIWRKRRNSALVIGALMQRVKEVNDSVIDLRIERPSLEQTHYISFYRIMIY